MKVICKTKRGRLLLAPPHGCVAKVAGVRVSDDYSVVFERKGEINRARVREEKIAYEGRLWVAIVSRVLALGAVTIVMALAVPVSLVALFLRDGYSRFDREDSQVLALLREVVKELGRVSRQDHWVEVRRVRDLKGWSDEDISCGE